MEAFRDGDVFSKHQAPRGGGGGRSAAVAVVVVSI